MSTRLVTAAVSLLLLVGPIRAQDGYKVEPIETAPPEPLPKAIAGELSSKGYHIVQSNGEPLARLWLRKAVPARSKPSGSEGAVQFPFLVTGELLGAIEYLAEGHDYRDQAIVPGVYTIRFGLHPVNGDHLGVSPFRDYGLLVPAALENGPEPLGIKDLEHDSAEAAGTNHPAVLLLTSVADTKESGQGFRDEAKGFWGVALPMTLKVDDEIVPEPFPLGLIYDGVAAQ